MCDMGGLDNLIANTAYLQARKSGDADKREVQKRRKTLALPRIDDSTDLEMSIKVDYESICEKQPIGKKFFQEFVEAVPEYLLASEFLDEATAWELSEDKIKSSILEGLVNMYLKNISNNYLKFLSLDLAKKCQVATKNDFENIMLLAMAEAKAFLKGKPFEEFQSSQFYEKFLQWKAFERQPVSEKDFEEFRVLGKGGFGEVCAVQVKNTGKMYACKKLDKKRLKKKSGEKMALLEKRILEKVNSRFIVSLAYAYQTKTDLCLVMTLMNGGDLRFHIYSVGERGLKMDRVIYYSAQITCGILHLHSISIMYRDMKPDNVLLDEHGNCRLSDLGLAVKVKEGKSITQRAGTNGYMAPEILKENEAYSYPVDWFAVGCTIYEMVAARTPFKDHKEKISKEELKRRTIEDEVKFEHSGFDEAAKDICKLFLAKKTEARLGSRNANDDPRKHHFFKSINFRRLEAGITDPPFVPDPSVIYAKDITDIAEFSEIQGVEFGDKDTKFFKKFSTGAVPISWQNEVIETGLFAELNDPHREIGGRGKSGVCLLF
ncbi:rhodopsin kinase GRK7 [Eublepharis macularius]|uniref:G protein-coupled receptor kinase n=1 Tax=Eublepharis macularius TaxID=481883 RepID=A0AA97JL33_EUBMA|nr:rhodopsin kinase GRK7 [Eublepharis macularius]